MLVLDLVEVSLELYEALLEFRQRLKRLVIAAGRARIADVSPSFLLNLDLFCSIQYGLTRLCHLDLLLVGPLFKVMHEL